MILMPPPWEGLHPAFPKRPDPFNTTSLTNAPVQGGTIGLAWTVGAAMFGKAPGTGLRAAAYVTLVSLVGGVAVEQYVGRMIAQPYLESKGLTVPRQKLVERPFHADENSFIIAGGCAAVLLSRMVAQPWAVTGWRRAIGAFSIGSFGGSLCSYGYHYNQIKPYAERLRQQKQVALVYSQDVKDFHRQRKDMGETQAANADRLTGGPPGMTSLQQLLKDVGNMTTGNNRDAFVGLPAAASHDLDEKDPQPHYSELRDGERIFKPETNYKWKPGPDGVEKLEEHISTLRERRTRLAQEAEHLFHNITAKEAEYYKTSSSTPAKDERRIALEVLNHLHINAYLEISQLDWCIADSQKNILQIRAMEKDTHWIPDAPKSTMGVPKHTLQLLDELERDNTFSLEELEMLKESTASALNDPNLEAIDTKTGQPVKDPYAAARKDIEEIERAQEEARIMRDAISRLRVEFEKGSK
ncbi:hypothetical protein MBLNU459_g3045t1 [Dothideomycetes sp. NU459]